jgi:hypothetical protein
MVTRSQRSGARRRERGMLMTELVIAVGILGLIMIPLSVAVLEEIRMCRVYYNDAVAMEIVDGEMEILAAGEWRAFREGEHTYPVKAGALTNLPPGRFVLTRTPKVVRLEWRPEKPGHGRAMLREVKLP